MEVQVIVIIHLWVLSQRGGRKGPRIRGFKCLFSKDFISALTILLLFDKLLNIIDKTSAKPSTLCNFQSFHLNA